MLEETKASCVFQAGHLGDYQKLTVEELADGYCDAKDAGIEEIKNYYISALILRFWNKIDMLNRACPNIGLSYEDFFFWVYEAIEYACKYRAWQNPEKNVNAKQAINQCINTIRLQHYYEYNLDKHRVNIGCGSLDEPLDADEDMTLGDTLVSEDSEMDYSLAGYFDAAEVVQGYINDGRIVDAIITDTMAFNPVEPLRRTKRVVKGEERWVEHSTEFWPFMLCKTLNNLPDSYRTYFTTKYRIDSEKLDMTLQTIKTSSNQKIYKWIDRTRNALKLALT